MLSIDEIAENFALLDDWEDRYRYVIELGGELTTLSEAEHSAENKVRGCASQVWLVSRAEANGAGGPVLHFRGDSDAHIVRGLIAILLATYSGHSAQDILRLDAEALFSRLGLREHLTQQRSNGLASMVERIRADASAALGSASRS
jgi:cysteine desulfuration protein SufE